MMRSALFLLLFAALGIAQSVATCYSADNAVIADCTCHESCATCGITEFDSVEDITGWDYCLSCENDADFISLYPDDDSDMTGICKGGCREEINSMDGCEGMGACLETLSTDFTTCQEGTAAICGLTETCDACKAELMALKECFSGLSTEAFIDVSVGVADTPCTELPMECMADDAGATEDADDAGASEGADDTGVDEGADETPASDGASDTAPSGGIKASFLSSITAFAAAVLVALSI